MPWVTLSLGSNTDADKNLRICLDALLLHFQDISLSSVFESEAVGFKGDNFLNMVVGFETEKDIEELRQLFKKIEAENGRDRLQEKFSGRTLDIDILTVDDWIGKFSGVELPRREITENAFVLWPLSQISGNKKHPVIKKSYKEIWHNYDREKQKLWPVDFEWHGKMISRK